jgi:hypothetical protein
MSPGSGTLTNYAVYGDCNRVGYSTPNRSYILSAVSEDGLTWEKKTEPVVSPGQGVWDAAKCSEMCVICLPRDEGQTPRYRIFYEASGGMAKDQRGVWHIASAVAELTGVPGFHSGSNMD